MMVPFAKCAGTVKAIKGPGENYYYWGARKPSLLKTGIECS